MAAPKPSETKPECINVTAGILQPLPTPQALCLPWRRRDHPRLTADKQGSPEVQYALGSHISEPQSRRQTLTPPPPDFQSPKIPSPPAPSCLPPSTFPAVSSVPSRGASRGSLPTPGSPPGSSQLDVPLAPRLQAAHLNHLSPQPSTGELDEGPVPSLRPSSFLEMLFHVKCPPRVTPKAIYGLWVLTMCRWRFINWNRSPTWWGCACGVGCGEPVAGEG